MDEVEDGNLNSSKYIFHLLVQRFSAPQGGHEAFGGGLCLNIDSNIRILTLVSNSFTLILFGFEFFAYQSRVANKIIGRKYVKTKSTFFIEEQGATSAEGLGRGATDHERLRTTALVRILLSISLSLTIFCFRLFRGYDDVKIF